MRWPIFELRRLRSNIVQTKLGVKTVRWKERKCFFRKKLKNKKIIQKVSEKSKKEMGQEMTQSLELQKKWFILNRPIKMTS